MDARRVGKAVVGTFPRERIMLRRVLWIIFWTIVLLCTIGDIAIARYIHLTF